ncbi:MAG TPA: serine/threonine-protein kinase [Pyrinomonadaceae bacterium]|nr:serine/threonine-protein kinase [Pyrinomonadaceae bacterium]
MLLSDRYRILQKIGVGGCGEVFLAKDIHLPSEPKCVVKQFKPSTSDPADYQLIKDKFKQEAAILEIVGHHDQIPQLYAFFEENGELYIVQQYIEGLTLAQKVKQDGVFDGNFVRDFLICLLPVISFIHSENIIHRDIKPDNIILRKEDGMPVLIDFGVVKDLEETIVNGQYSQTKVYSEGYTALEQIGGFPVFSSDLFSLGMTAIFMLTGKNSKDLHNKSLNKVDWIQGLPNFNTGNGFPIDLELSETISKAILDKNERFSNAEEMKRAVYFGVNKKIRRILFHTPYMLKVEEETEVKVDNSASKFEMEEYLPTDGEYQRCISWKVNK